MSAENSTKTAPGTPFQAGQSGNPGGRPKIPEEVREATRAACPEAVQLLVKIMRDEKQKTAYRLDAAKTLLDRGYGKPVQMQDVALDVSGGLDVEAHIRKVAMEMVDLDRRGNSRKTEA